MSFAIDLAPDIQRRLRRHGPAWRRCPGSAGILPAQAWDGRAEGWAYLSRAAMLQACALWRKRHRNGQTFYTGPMGGLHVFAFPNSKREKDTQPDARIVLAQRESKKDAELSSETCSAVVKPTNPARKGRAGARGRSPWEMT